VLSNVGIRAKAETPQLEVAGIAETSDLHMLIVTAAFDTEGEAHVQPPLRMPGLLSRSDARLELPENTVLGTGRHQHRSTVPLEDLTPPWELVQMFTAQPFVPARKTAPKDHNRSPGIPGSLGRK
jgi:hypothetical protein